MRQPVPPPPEEPARQEPSPYDSYLEILRRFDLIRVGMVRQEVIGLLGKPTSTRPGFLQYIVPSGPGQYAILEVYLSNGKVTGVGRAKWR